MRWRFWEPMPEPPVMPAFGEVMAALPPRRLTLTHLDVIGSELRRHAAAPAYRIETTQTMPAQELQLADLEKLLPQQLAISLVAVGDPSESGTPASLRLNIQPGSPATLSARGASVANMDYLTVWYGHQGDPVRNRAWLYPAGFLASVLVALGCLLTGWITGSVSLWLLPLALGMTVMSFVLAPAPLQAAVAREQRRHSGAEIDLRPIERVHLDREQHRQRRQVALLYGSVAAVLGAVAGGVLTGLLHLG